MENPETIWLVGVAALVAGILIGVLAYRRLFAPKIEEAERTNAELDAARAELESFRTSVNEHFDKTSELVNDLTQNYARVYQHLAEGAQTLGDGKRFSNVLEQQPGRVSIALDDASVVPGKPVEPAAAPSPAAAAAEAPTDDGGETREANPAKPASASESTEPVTATAGIETPENAGPGPASTDVEKPADATDEPREAAASAPGDRPEISGDPQAEGAKPEAAVDDAAADEAGEKSGSEAPAGTEKPDNDETEGRDRSVTRQVDSR